MATINRKNYSSPRNINLKDGCLRFGATQSTDPFDSDSSGLYIDSSKRLVYPERGNILAKGFSISDGGTVTQGTNITTGVTLNTTTSQITTASTTLAAADEAEFVVTNSTVAATSVVVASLAVTSSTGTPAVTVSRIAAGQFTIMVQNLHASVALNNTLVINFAVFGGSAT